MENGYIMPKAACAKLTEAEKNKKTVYIFAMSGYGKTSLVRNFYESRAYCYFDMYSSPYDILNADISRNSVVVIDNLSFLTDKTIQDKVLQLSYSRDCHCILISRSKCPEWLITAGSTLGGLKLISQADLGMTLENTKEILSMNNVTDTDEESLLRIHRDSQGHPLFIKYIANRIVTLRTQSGKNEGYDDTILAEARKLLADYIDHEVLERLSDSLIDFVVKMSIVEKFTIPFAVEISGINNVEAYIDEAEKIGSFMEYEDGMYRISKPFRIYLLSRMYTLFPKEKISEIYSFAGNYYKRHGRILEAYHMFDKADSYSQKLDILIENARLNPSDGYLTELKDAYLSLDRETVCTYPELIAAVCMLYSLMLDITQSDYWYAILQEKAEALTGKPQKVAKRYLTYLDVACIHKPGRDVMQILKDTAAAVFDKSVIVPEWAITCNGPTIMNGGRDFCEWSKRDTELYKILAVPFKTVFGKSSAGMAELSLAESYWEKGESDYEIMRLVSKGQMEADMRGRAELSFVAVGLLAQLHMLHDHKEDAISIIKAFREKNLNANPKLIKNIDTVLCRIALLTGDTKTVDIWMESAPDEESDFNVLYRYMYMCKIRCYLFANKYEKAFTLLNKMMFYADMCERTFIKIECLLLMAVWERRSGLNEWDATLCSALEYAENYNFVRIFSREGAAIIDMLKRCSYRYSSTKFKKQLFEDVEQMSAQYPAYLNTEVQKKPEIPENALSILKLQSQGFSNDEIAKMLFISTNTVKYHCKENYRKLGVNNRQEAIVEARKRGLL